MSFFLIRENTHDLFILTFFLILSLSLSFFSITKQFVKESLIFFNLIKNTKKRRFLSCKKVWSFGKGKEKGKEDLSKRSKWRCVIFWFFFLWLLCLQTVSEFLFVQELRWSKIIKIKKNENQKRKWGDEFHSFKWKKRNLLYWW